MLCITFPFSIIKLLIFINRFTICGIQQTTKDIDNNFISLENAFSSGVVIPSWFGGPATFNKGFALDDALDILLKAPVRCNFFKALETVKLHETIDEHKTVPKIIR